MWSYLTLGSCLFAAAALLPAADSTEARACPIGAPTAKSYTWNFPREAEGLLDDIESDASHARMHADLLEHMMWHSNTGWQMEARELDQIRTAVNDMGTRLCRLETIRRVVSPWERKAIDSAAPQIVEMASEAQAAITYLDDNRNYLFNPEYTRYGADLYQRSARLANSMSEMEKFGKVHQEDMQLEKSLGLIDKS
jgi:hypothetical protein